MNKFLLLAASFFVSYSTHAQDLPRPMPPIDSGSLTVSGISFSGFQNKVVIAKQIYPLPNNKTRLQTAYLGTMSVMGYDKNFKTVFQKNKNFTVNLTASESVLLS